MVTMCECGGSLKGSYGSLCEDCWVAGYVRIHDYNKINPPTPTNREVHKTEVRPSPLKYYSQTHKSAKYDKSPVKHWNFSRFVGPPKSICVKDRREKFDLFSAFFEELWVAGAPTLFIAECIGVEPATVQSWRRRLKLIPRTLGGQRVA